MKINFKQPKYVLPALALPFLCLFFYVWHSGFSKPKKEKTAEAGLNSSVGSVSSSVRKKELADKLDAYRNTYKEADGYSAVNVIPREASTNATFKDSYTGREKQTLDSIDRAMKAKYNTPPVSGRDKALAGILNTAPRRQRQENKPAPVREKDPMEVFKQQMAYMDSVSKMNDPAYKAEKQKRLAAEKAAQEKASETT